MYLQKVNEFERALGMARLCLANADRTGGRDQREVDEAQQRLDDSWSARKQLGKVYHACKAAAMEAAWLEYPWLEEPKPLEYHALIAHHAHCRSALIANFLIMR